MTSAAPTPRIAPLDPPYTPEVGAMLERWMPPGNDIEPLRLFRTLAVHHELASRMRPLGAAILRHGLIDPRERELMIHRTCARTGAEYEWGVHALAFGAPLGLSDAQLAATVNATHEHPVWSAHDALLIRLADELHDTCRVSEQLWASLAQHYTDAQLLELLVIAGHYRVISYVVNAVRIEPEPWAARFPAS
ncbi:MAG TPA: carboxymuconolactone decarboxylase family protein [Solirubrobacteraceae bacterium]|nr:carboxymuconolactone decarboxylase family protein [Solirubrobacteraceae bacterium]